MAKQVINPFEDEKPQIVHLEKSESHYEYCRMQMHDIESVHRRTFFCNLVLCILVCFFSIFKKYIAIFDLFSRPFLSLDKPQAILTGGIFQILFGMAIILLGYLAWANYRTLNIILWAWYMAVTVFGVLRLDYLSAIIGVIGAVFYGFSIRELRHEQALAQMEGYPDFHEKFDVSKSDIVIETLRAHQGERRTKSTLFTTDYSLRRKRKKSASFGYAGSDSDSITDTGAALADALQNSLNEARSAKEAETAQAETVSEKTDTADMTDLIPDPADKPESKPENIEPARADAEAAAAAILAEAESRTQKQLAENTEKNQSAQSRPHQTKKKHH